MNFYSMNTLKDVVGWLLVIVFLVLGVMDVELLLGDLVHRHRERKLLKKMAEDAKALRTKLEKELEVERAERLWKAGESLKPVLPRTALDLNKEVADSRYEAIKGQKRCGTGTCGGCDRSLNLDDERYVICLDGTPHLMRKEAFCFWQELE